MSEGDIRATTFDRHWISIANIVETEKLHQINLIFSINYSTGLLLRIYILY
jgi:hypothetical protein